MEISGHQTRSIFERYNIVSGHDLKMAAEKMHNRFKQSLKSLAKRQETASRKIQ